jgi:threonyl-tRNA synthetase
VSQAINCKCGVIMNSESKIIFQNKHPLSFSHAFSKPLSKKQDHVKIGNKLALFLYDARNFNLGLVLFYLNQSDFAVLVCLSGTVRMKHRKNGETRTFKTKA